MRGGNTDRGRDKRNEQVRKEGEGDSEAACDEMEKGNRNPAPCRRGAMDGKKHPPRTSSSVV